MNVGAQDEHGIILTRPYATFVGASDPARKVHDLGQETLVFALASSANGLEIFTPEVHA